MKKIFVLGITVLALAVVVSCKKNSDDNPTTPPASFSVTVDGTAWNSTLQGAQDTANILSIGAFNGNDNILLQVKKAALGTYPMNDSTFGSALIGGKMMNSMLVTPNVGQVVITKCDLSAKLVSGTFYFDAIESLEGQVHHFTNGTFSNIPLTVSK